MLPGSVWKLVGSSLSTGWVKETVGKLDIRATMLMFECLIQINSEQN